MPCSFNLQPFPFESLILYEKCKSLNFKKNQQQEKNSFSNRDNRFLFTCKASITQCSLNLQLILQCHLQHFTLSKFALATATSPDCYNNVRQVKCHPCSLPAAIPPPPFQSYSRKEIVRKDKRKQHSPLNRFQRRAYFVKKTKPKMFSI